MIISTDVKYAMQQIYIYSLFKLFIFTDGPFSTERVCTTSVIFDMCVTIENKYKSNRNDNKSQN